MIALHSDGKNSIKLLKKAVFILISTFSIDSYKAGQLFFPFPTTPTSTLFSHVVTWQFDVTLKTISIFHAQRWEKEV